jgi:hypothetical protein
MHEDKPSPFGESEARRMLEAGWRQGSVCRPPADLAIPVPLDREAEWMVVCTQSCTVVSRSLVDDPHVEFLVAKPAESYNPSSQEATGKTPRRFHLPVSGRPGVAALDCDINRRFFVPRSLCLTFTPDAGIMVSEEASRNLAGWISRYYTRVALPNELVIRAKNLFDIIKTALKKSTGGGNKLSEFVDKIYVQWKPDGELQAGLYEVNILFLCSDRNADLLLDTLLEVKLKPFTEENGCDGIKLTYANTVRSETFISQLDGYKRLSEWDYLSNLGDIAESEH